MKRSKSSFSQTKKNICNSQRSRKSKSNKKVLKINTERKKTGDNQLIRIQQITHSNKNIEKRLKNIRQGFQTLQNNLNFDALETVPKIQKVINHQNMACLTQTKLARKLFQNETKKTIKKKKCFVGSSSHHKITNYNSLYNKNQGMCSEARYHTCLYEQSLMSLMKVVSMQKKQITRLNAHISQQNKYQ